MNRFRRLRHTFLALLAVLCLFGMQQGAAFHGLSHLAEESAAGQQKHLPHSKTCDKCVVYAEVSGGAPTTSRPAFALPAQLAVNIAPTYQFLPAVSPPVYSARAPPLSV